MNKLLIFLIILILFFVVIPSVRAGAFLYFSPSQKTFDVGDEFFISVKINTGGIPTNAVKTVLYFPKDKLSVLDISKDGSIFSLWPEEPKFSNETGEISFVGGVPHPGFSGTDGHIVSIEFRAKERGIVELNFGETAILASDGKGTNIFSYAKKGKYSLNFPAPIILSNTHPNEDKWYQNNNPEFRWKLVDDAIGASFVLDNNSDTEPDNIPEGKLDSKVYQEFDDGTWYFHLKIKDNLGWSSTRHLSVKIDSVSPSPFEIVVNNEGDPTNPRPILYFDVSDETSGIDYYRIGFENGDSVILANPGINQYQLPLQEPGTHQIVVQTYDKAGNFRENIAGVVIQPIQEPIVTIWPKVYVAGEEKFYTEGTSLPKTEITILLEKDGNISKEWQALTSAQGNWSFYTADLLRSGIYHLFARAKDERGALSEFSQKQEVEVTFSGLILGSFLITYRTMVSILAIILLALIVVAVYLIYQGMHHRKTLKKETKEAEESLHTGFSELKQDIIKELEKLESVKSQRELNEKEKEIIENLKEDLKKVEKFIGKEIKDIDKYL